MTLKVTSTELYHVSKKDSSKRGRDHTMMVDGAFNFVPACIFKGNPDEFEKQRPRSRLIGETGKLR